jgi:hypothetical protein
MARTNRRQDAASRANVERASQVSIIIKGKQVISGKLKDYGKGGIGIEIEPSAVIHLMGVDGVIVVYALCGVKVEDKFLVRSVDHKRMRIGLQYEDGKRFNPQQRARASYKA